jgi:hypothetical protein
MHLYPKICTLSRNFLWIWPQAHNLSHLVWNIVMFIHDRTFFIKKQKL